MLHRLRPWVWLLGGFVLAASLGFSANPAPQPQRVSDLVARMEALETTSSRQAEELATLAARVASLERARARRNPGRTRTPRRGRCAA